MNDLSVCTGQELRHLEQQTQAALALPLADDALRSGLETDLTEIRAEQARRLLYTNSLHKRYLT